MNIAKSACVFVFSGPSGAGKSTLLGLLMQRNPKSFAFSTSHTTRKIRPGEVDGKDYHFVDTKLMQKLISEGEFLEHAEFAGNLYGTSLKAVQAVLDSGLICILDVDMQGVKSIHSLKSPLEAKYIFVQPSSKEALEARLRARHTETEETLSNRLQRAEQDMQFAQSPEGRNLFDKIIINDSLEDAYNELLEYMRPALESSKSE